MYSRYIPPGTSYSPIPEEETPAAGPKPGQRPPPSRDSAPQVQKPGTPPRKPPAGSDLLGSVTQEIGKLLSGLNISLQDLDTGDILLILIILFLFLEGDNLDLVIALGLMLLLSLTETDKQEEPPEAQPST